MTITDERLRELRLKLRRRNMSFRDMDNTLEAIDELLVLRRAIGEDSTAWVKNPTIDEVWSPVGSRSVQFQIEHDGDLWDAIAAARREEEQP